MGCHDSGPPSPVPILTTATADHQNYPSEWDGYLPNVMSLKNLTPHEKHQLLENSGYLSGVCVDKIDSPRWLMRPVAKLVGPGKSPLVQDMNNTLTEVIATKNERESNYVHQGWSLAAASTISPWTSARIANNNQPNPDGEWVTRRTIVQRLSLCVSLQELEPDPAFEAEIEAALEKENTFEQFQAVYCALHNWGDVVPLEIDIGVSLSFTDTETNLAKLPITGSYRTANQLAGIRTGRIAKKGGNPNNSEWSAEDWPTKTVSPLQWSQVRIVSVAPTIDLLNDTLKSELFKLYAQRLSYFPPFLTWASNHKCKTHDDTHQASGTISSVSIRSSDFLEVLSIAYLNNEKTEKHGGGGHVGNEHKFTLTNGEHITEMLIWIETEWVMGLQFITNLGRCSPCYGSGKGRPTVAKSRGGILTGFSSLIQKHPQWNDMYSRGIWRHDLIGAIPKQDDVCSEYFGGEGGNPFNDRVFVRNSNSLHISKVEIEYGNVIASIQFTYRDMETGGTSEIKTARHGSPSDVKKQFVLEPGEHIVGVSGRYDANNISQLCFMTSLSRMSELFGGGGGQSFPNLSARGRDEKSMRLHYVCGKCDPFLNGIMFVWTPL
ncbi:hypothetical protein CTheo_3706 [Ceratobasidium theobromae]|uniref:Jacalin-type lectin domain-containing protein n=1 Tax=Ceratobasidium theobromae TaxID=1582974 RepID=A0A5N5QNX3_9AGAM|nr:hypothetical protein CTheo_3706 [Ceratobasidium theobromae]